MARTKSSYPLTLKPGETILFQRRTHRLLGGSDLWLLTSQRLLIVRKNILEERSLYFPAEQVISHETGDLQFSGNVHLITDQRLLVLDVGAKNYLLESIPLTTISGVDIVAIGDVLQKTIRYGLQIHLAGALEPVVIKHGEVTTDEIHRQKLSPIERQQVNERLPREICELTGLEFAPPHKRIGAGGVTIVSFYSKSNLVWPARCSACTKNADKLVFDECKVENPWLAAGYRLGHGLIAEFIYRVPYCRECFDERFASGKEKSAVKEGTAKSDGARVELCFENQAYALEFIQANSVT